MTKKDYIKIADVIRQNFDGTDLTELVLPTLAMDLAVVFASDNPQFDQDRFLEACGL